MAWMTKHVHAIYGHRCCLVDTALVRKALTGDVPAIKLFYERVGQLTQDKTINVNYSGGVCLTSLGDDDLLRLIKDADAKLPAEYQTIDAEFEAAPGDAVPGAGGDPAPDAAGPTPVLPTPDEEPREADRVPREGEGLQDEVLLRGEPEREDDSGGA
jgi:hypothetical protein